MKFKENDKSKAICHNCGLINTTFKHRDVNFSSNIEKIINLLVGVCDVCDSTISIPSQATNEIKSHIDNVRKD